MLSIATLMIMLAQAPADAAQPPHQTQWTARPSARDLAGCIPGDLPRGKASVTLLCRSAEREQLSDCKVAEVVGTMDPRVERAALCAVKHFRARVTDADGKPVLGAPVLVPLDFTRR